MFVVDMGAGYGDMCLNVLQAGAEQVLAIDKSADNLQIAAVKCEDYGEKFSASSADLNDVRLISWLGEMYDIGIFMSVLPYLADKTAILKAMAEAFHLVFFECQYAGDGPGLDFIRNDDDMDEYLRTCGFKTRHILGKTLIKDRDKHRTIWAIKG